jgi:hypothetical protein
MKISRPRVSEAPEAKLDFSTQVRLAVTYNKLGKNCPIGCRAVGV